MYRVTFTQGRSDRVFAQTTPRTADKKYCTEIAILVSINQLKEGNSYGFELLKACGSKAVPALIGAINHEDETTRIVSIAILGEIGTDARDAIPFLAEVLEDQSEDNLYNRVVTVHALGNIGIALVTRKTLYRRRYRRRIRRGVDELRRIGIATVPALTTALEDEDEAVRNEATIALRIMVFKARLRSRRGPTRSPATGNRSLARIIANYRNNNPPVICKYPVIKDFLLWKCPKTEPATTETETSPKPVNTFSPPQPQPVKK